MIVESERFGPIYFIFHTCAFSQKQALFNRGSSSFFIIKSLMYILLFVFFYLNIQLSLILIQFRTQNLFRVKLIFRAYQIWWMINTFPRKISIELFRLTNRINLIVVKLLNHEIYLCRCVLFNYFQKLFSFQSFFPLILTFIV